MAQHKRLIHPSPSAAAVADRTTAVTQQLNRASECSMVMQCFRCQQCMHMRQDMALQCKGLKSATAFSPKTEALLLVKVLHCSPHLSCQS
jgi:hypothetical protein